MGISELRAWSASMKLYSLADDNVVVQPISVVPAPNLDNFERGWQPRAGGMLSRLKVTGDLLTARSSVGSISVASTASLGTSRPSQGSIAEIASDDSKSSDESGSESDGEFAP